MKKNINQRCPLSAECERKTCAFISHEIDCTYYATNGFGENGIPDQEQMREEREAERMRELEEKAFDEIEEYSDLQSQIVMLPVSALYPHPDNPRKDVGDVTELAESIKANGILQNLTVVPSPTFHGQYTVIIGHRRLAASKVAGLDTVPCVISDMTPEEQIATMLTENMQRTDLTVYEQAKAFQQLSIDLGMSVAEISEMSGFSETTVRRRTKLADLDEKAFKKACDRGATLFDFAELDKIEDPKAKQKCLDAAGTANFKNEIKVALDKQRLRKKIEKWQEQISAFATRIEKVEYTNGHRTGEVDGECVPMHYIRNYTNWTKDETVETPEDAKEVRYFYIASESSIDLYKEAIPNSAEEEEKRRKEEIRKMDADAWERMREIEARHRELRQEFVLNFGAVKSNIAVIMSNLASAMVSREAARHHYINAPENEDLCEMLGVSYDENIDKPDRQEFAKFKAEQPERLMLIMAYWYYETGDGYAKQDWVPGLQRYVIRYKDNQKLDELYYFLEELGYERSDEERQLSRGTHELFYKEGDNE